MPQLRGIYQKAGLQKPAAGQPRAEQITGFGFMHDGSIVVAGLNANTETRASVLRRVAESDAFIAREKNRAFVLMQYLGYLRRNPEDPPEATLDLAGFNFWLTKLNNHGGNFVEAEMVKSFLVSGEYQGRFRQ